MSEVHRIASDPEKCGGRPIIRGLRIRVKEVLDLLAGQDFPTICSALESGETLVELV